jgi:hypothetical protein
VNGVGEQLSGFGRRSRSRSEARVGVAARAARWLVALPFVLGSATAAAGDPKPPPLIGAEARGGAPDDAEARSVGAGELCKTHWTIDGDWLPYCRNQRLGERRETIRRAVIVIHGKHRNARSYFDAVSRLATEEGHAQDTLVIALQFLTRADVDAHQLSKDTLYWDQEGWKDGLKSVNGFHLSSFDVLDRVLKRALDQNPNLQQIVIAGHSAGAQFVQKHAASRRLDLSAWKGELRYVVTNPGSYMYLTSERPGSTSGCQDRYDDYRYGLANNRLEYFMGTSPDSMRQKFAQYPVTILLGSEDTEAEGDQSCPARAQGKNRLERGQNFHRLTAKQLASEPARGSRFKLQIVPHVGHAFERMWDSRCGRDLLFGSGECRTASAARAAFPL